MVREWILHVGLTIKVLSFSADVTLVLRECFRRGSLQSEGKPATLWEVFFDSFFTGILAMF